MFPLPVILLGIGAAALLFLRKKNDGSIPASELPKSTTDALNLAISDPSFANLATAHALLIQSGKMNEPQVQQAFQVLKNLTEQKTPRSAPVSSGTVTFQQQLVNLFDDGTQMIDVFLQNGTRLFRYRFNVPTFTRQLVTITPGAPNTAVQSAMQALGVSPGQVKAS